MKRILVRIAALLFVGASLGGCLSQKTEQPAAVAPQPVAALPAQEQLAESFALGNIYGNSMVLQRGQPIPVLGKADAGKSVELTLGEQTLVVAAGQDGRFLAEFDALPASATPITLTVRGKDKEIVLEDILVGDVWIGSGQSNMEWRVRNSMNVEAEKAAATNSLIRYYNVRVEPSVGKIAEDIREGREWTVVSPETVENASAVMYFFARDLQPEIGVPVGIINASRGGSRIEPWISAEAYRAAGEEEMYALAVDEPDPAVVEKLQRESRERFTQWEKDLFSHYAEQVSAAAGWSAADLDVTGWAPVRVPTMLDEAGIAGNGVVWFRKSVQIPADWAGKDLTLSLGVVDDCDESYWNGELVGSTGTDVPEYWAARRVYTVPAKDVKAGEQNMIAMRLIDHSHAGGIKGNAKTICVYPAGQPEAAIDLTGEWLVRVEFLIDWRAIKPRPEPFFVAANTHGRTSALYNGMIAPLQVLPVSGVLWYQGESNVGGPGVYAKRFPLLIESWRDQWNQPELPFIYAQLSSLVRHSPNRPLEAGYLENLEPEESGWAGLREAQANALKLPATAMVVTTDIGDPIDIHPANKQDVGGRMAQEALRIVYGQEDIVSRGPSYKGMSVEGNVARITFDNVGSGLEARGGALGHFAIAGEDGTFYWADARIDGDSVLVSAEQVAAPKAVRYAWANYPHGANLYNKEGLPAVPFRTDTPAYLQD